MKILYIAKHQSGDNDDEGSILDALQHLGHEVICIHEKRRHRQLVLTHPSQMDRLKADFCLFHKWESPTEISQMKTPKCFWYFDLVHSDDPLLVERSKFRVNWFRQVMPHVHLAFCTDGDWVLKQKETAHGAKYRWLMQGADQRVVGVGTPDPNLKLPPLLFAGMINHGSKRVEQIGRLRERYGDKLMLLGEGGARNRKHGRELADIMANVKIVIAPGGPSTDHYWSNRVFQALGFGAFLLHPRCANLDIFYDPGVHYLAYDNSAELSVESIIDEFIVEGAAEVRQAISQNALRRTIECNLYLHRVEALVQHMKEVI